EVRYPGSAIFTLRDPYSFPPTLGELDSHLAAEGRHERLWERLGAHPAHHRGTYGTSFAVWAPTARSVSVVGDFNSWDGRLHPMRALGSTGIWELFVPEVGPGRSAARRLRRGDGLHPRGAAARRRAPLRRILGLPGDGVLRADRAARPPRRLPRPHRRAPRTRDRRHPRLGAGALPHRSPRA